MAHNPAGVGHGAMLAAAGVRGKPVSSCIMSENLTSCLADLCSCCKHGMLEENACLVYSAGKLWLVVSLFKPLRSLALKTS